MYCSSLCETLSIDVGGWRGEKRSGLDIVSQTIALLCFSLKNAQTLEYGVSHIRSYGCSLVDHKRLGGIILRKCYRHVNRVREIPPLAQPFTLDSTKGAFTIR